MKKQSENYGLELEKAYEQWAHYYEHGGSDPFWEDGANLNLIRNHIFYYRSKIEENPTLFGYPAAYYKEIPPEVDSKYMARPDEIRKNAKAALAKYKADANYQYILKHYNDFSPKTRNKLYVDNVIGYATGLEYYIENDKLVDMRRHERCEHYLQSFEDCVRRMQATPRESVQLTLFSLIDGLDANSNDDDFDDEMNEEYNETDTDFEMY